MKQINNIYMTNDNSISGVTYADNIEIKKATWVDLNSTGFNIFINKIEADNAVSMRDAIRLALEYAVDDHIDVLGSGIYAGCKFWQLPAKLQAKIIKLARNKKGY